MYVDIYRAAALMLRGGAAPLAAPLRLRTSAPLHFVKAPQNTLCA